MRSTPPAFDEVKDIAVDDAANIYAAGSASGAFLGETADALHTGYQSGRANA
jgi:hypothetical protein